MVRLDADTEEVFDEYLRLREMYALKSVLRYETRRDTTVHSESVGEHLFGMQLLAHYFLPLEDPLGRLDRIRVSELILFHEIGEIETGDIVTHKKSLEHSRIEREAAERVAARLPASLREIAWKRFVEFDDVSTDEAAFVEAIDKIEPIFELYDDMRLASFIRLGVSREAAIGKKLKVTEQYPYLRKFLDAWLAYADGKRIFAEPVPVHANTPVIQ